MVLFLFVTALLILLCVLTSKVLYRFGVPTLLIFLALGMLMGSEGIGGIYFEDFEMASSISTLAIVLIVFYGGFGTKWETAKPMALKAGLLSSFGTMITALVAGLLCMVILGVPLIYGLLFGAVVASTDAAALFSILRSQKLNLKHGLAPLLEVESGSNDPFAYMLTLLIISVIQTDGHGANIGTFLLSFAMQIGIAIIIGAVASIITVLLLRHLQLQIQGFYPIMLLAMVILSFSLTTLIGGNGLLCVYILGMVVGNSKFLHKISLVHFFDGLSWLMQILLFFILGLLSTPSNLPNVFLTGTMLSLLLIFVARPIGILGILSWFKIPIKQQVLVSWVGLRGATSIVFSIVALEALGELPYDLFHLVFFVALFSILIQGTLTPLVSKKLDLVDETDENAVLKTFTDYESDIYEQLFEYTISTTDKLVGERIVDADIPDENLIIMIKRGKDIIVPKGTTQFKEDDVLVISGENFDFFMN